MTHNVVGCPRSLVELHALSKDLWRTDAPTLLMIPPVFNNSFSTNYDKIHFLHNVATEMKNKFLMLPFFALATSPAKINPPIFSKVCSSHNFLPRALNTETAPGPVTGSATGAPRPILMTPR